MKAINLKLHTLIKHIVENAVRNSGFSSLKFFPNYESYQLETSYTDKTHCGKCSA